jgi:hypothetical protein
MLGLAWTPLQLGAGVSGGTPSLAHALRSGISADPACVTIQVDFRNAFNEITLSVVLAAVSRRAPQLLPFAWWVYRQHTPLLVRGAPPDTVPLLSQRGVRQGDPCSMLLFSLGLQDVLEVTCNAHPDMRVVAYAEDVYVQGPSASVALAFRTLTRQARDIGLTARPDKCWP